MTWVQTIFHKLAAHMSDLRGADFKIAFYLVSEVVATGNAEISLSERALSDATGISLSTIRASLVRLGASGLFLREPGGYHRKDRYLLPAFRPPAGVPVSATLTPGDSLAGVPDSDTPRLAPDLVGVPVSDTQCADFRYTSVPVSATPQALLPDAHNMERARAPVESSSFVGSSSSSIDSILLTKTLRENQRDEAEVLRRYMRSFIVRCADASLDGKPIDDAIVAQCLAIAPAGLLMKCLDEFRFRHVPPFQTLGWFVTAFLKHFMGVPPSEVKARRGALRIVRKPQNVQAAETDFTSDLTKQLVESVRGLG